MEAKNFVKGFLKKHGMYFEDFDMEQCRRTFVHEMENGLAREESSLEMIPTYISAEGQIPCGEPVIAIDAGGTNFRVAVITFDRDKKPIIEDFQLFTMPGTKGEISSTEFFETTAEYLKPLLDKSNKIGFCFSYPTEILPNKDGKLIRFSKEVQVNGMEGRLIGAELIDSLKKYKSGTGKSIVLLNDTVATLLAGKAAFPERIFSSYIGFILGTGTNTCYIEKTRCIGKLPCRSEVEDFMLINVESGAYDKAPGGAIDAGFDRMMRNPGQYRFEKMISGGYMGGLILAVIRQAVDEGLFSSGFAGRLKKVKSLESIDIDMFLYYPYSMSNILAVCCGINDSEAYTRDKSENAGNCGAATGNSRDKGENAGNCSISAGNSGVGHTDAAKTDAHIHNFTNIIIETGFYDRSVLYYLIDAVIERAAKLVAINLSAVMEKTGKGKNPCAPVCITVDGSTFYKSKLFRDKLNYYVKSFINEQRGIYCEFVKVENGTLIGTAIAGLIG
jgi:hexokinase